MVGHIGIIKVEEEPTSKEEREIYLVHASGIKEKGGGVKKVLLKDYITRMPFIGVKVTRFR
jgi:hypothetical protein